MITAYLIDPVSLKHLLSRDARQNPTWETLALMGRVVWGSKLVRNAQGEQVVSAAKVYLPASVAIVTTNDRMIIDGAEHAIIRVEKKTDFSTSHWEIYLS